MGILSSIGGAFNAIGGWNTVGGALNAAGSIYDIYNGYQSNKLAEKYANQAFGSAAAQDQYAREMWNREKELYWPLENLNVQYEMEDLQALRPSYQRQVAYQGQRMDEQLAQAKELNPLLDDTEKSLVRKLVEGEDVLAERMMNEATTDVANAFGTQREQDTRAMGLAGVNPNSGQFANYTNRMGQSQALAEAGARTQSSRQAEELAISRQSAALNYRSGAQLPTYDVNTSVDSGAILGGLGGSGNAYTGLSQMYNKNAQDSYNGAWYQLNQLSGGNVNPGWTR